MQTKYVEHYIAMLCHLWFKNIADQVGNSPFRAVVQNYMYYQNPDEPDKVRLQSFITALIGLYNQIKDLPDPDPAPPLTEVELDKYLQKVTIPPPDLSTAPQLSSYQFMFGGSKSGATEFKNKK